MARTRLVGRNRRPHLTPQAQRLVSCLALEQRTRCLYRHLPHQQPERSQCWQAGPPAWSGHLHLRHRHLELPRRAAGASGVLYQPARRAPDAQRKTRRRRCHARLCNQRPLLGHRLRTRHAARRNHFQARVRDGSGKRQHVLRNPHLRSSLRPARHTRANHSPPGLTPSPSPKGEGSSRGAREWVYLHPHHRGHR